MKTSLKIYVTAAVLATASLAYGQAQDPATMPSDTTTTPAATTPSTTPAATPSTTPAATTPSTSGTTEDGDDNMADDDTSLAPRSDRN